MRVDLPTLVRQFALTLVLAGGYLLLARIGLSLADHGDEGPTLWPASAGALAAMLVFGWRAAPGVFVGALLACATSDDALLVACVEAVGNTIEPMLGAWLLGRVGDFDARLRSVRDFVLLVMLGGMGSPLLGAAFGAAAHLLGGEIAATQFASEMLARWTHTAMGVVTITPFMLLWALDRPPFSGRWLERSVLLLATLFAGTVVFGDELRLGAQAPHEQWMLVFVIWAALRFGRHCVSLVLLLIFAQALYFSAHHVGPLYDQGGPHWLALVLFNQVFLALIGLSVTTAYAQRLEAERRYLDEHALLRRLIDSMPDMIFYKDRNSRYLGCNAACESFFGVPPAQVVGRTDDDFYPREEAASYRATDRRAMEGEDVLVYEEPIAYRDGRMSTVETRKTPFIGANGQLLGVIGISRDIAERKKAQHERDLMQRAMSLSINEVHIFDGETQKFLFGNQRALDNLGYSVAEFQSMTPSDILAVPPPMPLKEMLAPLEDGSQRAMKIRAVHLRKDGTTYDVETQIEYRGEGDERYFLAMCLDVTEAEGMRRRLRETERHFQMLMENVSDVIWEVDLEWNYLYMSPSIEKLRGYTVEEVMREPKAARYTPETYARIEVMRERLVASNGRDIPERMEVEVTHKNGSTVWGEVSFSPIYDDGGRIKAVGAVTRDITRRKRAEEALSRLNAELEQRIAAEIEKSRQKDLQMQQQERLAQMGEMIGIIAHQWRQPLNALGIVMADLEDAYAHGQCDAHYLKNALDRVNTINHRLSRTIDEFRNFYRVQTQAAAFDLVDVTRECVALIAPMLEHAKITVKFHGVPAVGVKGRAGDYSQVILSLVGNAKDAIVASGRSDGCIEFTVGQDSEQAVVIVADNGGGIAPDVLPRVFDPYFTTKTDGSGIGLYMSRLVVEKAMAGSIAVSSEAGWTRFVIRLQKNMPEREDRDDKQHA